MSGPLILVGTPADVRRWWTQHPQPAAGWMRVTSIRDLPSLRRLDPDGWDVVLLPSARRLPGWPAIERTLAGLRILAADTVKTTGGLL